MTAKYATEIKSGDLIFVDVRVKSPYLDSLLYNSWVRVHSVCSLVRDHDLFGGIVEIKVYTAYESVLCIITANEYRVFEVITSEEEGNLVAGLGDVVYEQLGG